MKRFNITVNGKAYDVSVEELNSNAPAAVSAPVHAAAAPVSAPAAAPAGSTSITSPMPGTILDVKTAVGNDVTYGQVLIVLEAMKMENDIVASVAGKITSVNVKKGDAVKTGDVLVSIQ